MNNKQTIALLSASCLAGFIYWLFEFGEYLVGSLVRGQLPLDAFVILIPIMLFAIGVGVLFFIPVFLVLKKYGQLKLHVIVISSTILSIVYELTITRKIDSIELGVIVGPAIAGSLGGLLFYQMTKQRNEN